MALKAAVNKADFLDWTRPVISWKVPRPDALRAASTESQPQRVKPG